MELSEDSGKKRIVGQLREKTGIKNTTELLKFFFKSGIPAVI